MSTNSSDIKNEIGSLESRGKDRYQIVQSLVRKGYAEQEIVEALDGYQFNTIYKGNWLGILFLGLGGFCIYAIKSTFGDFDFEFDSTGDYYRFNEWVMKPYLILLCAFTGILLLVNRFNCNKAMKYGLLASFLVALFTSFMGNSLSTLLIAALGLICTLMVRTFKLSTDSDGQRLYEAVRLNRPPSKILRSLGNSGWKGSALFIPLLLNFIFALNTPIRTSREFMMAMMRKEDVMKPPFLDDFLLTHSWWLLTSSVLLAGLLAIDYKRFSFLMKVFAMLHLIYAIFLFSSGQKQLALIPCIFFMVLTAITFLKNRPTTKSEILDDKL